MCCAWLIGGIPQMALATDAGFPSHHALVVGNSAYGSDRLATPAVDAKAVARQLKAHGYDVALLRDATGDQLRAATAAFKRRLIGAHIGVFYYSGRFTTSAGETYLLGSDIDPASGAGGNAVPAAAVSVGSIVTSMAAAGPRISNVVVLDLQGAGGPVPVETPENFSITTVHGHGPTQDAPALSAFAAAFLEELGTSAQPVDAVFQKIRAALGKQPIVRNVSSLSVEITLAPPAGARNKVAYATRGIRVSSADRLPEQAPRAVTAAEQSRGIKIADSSPAFEFSPKFEKDLWAIIKNSQNAADFEAYLDVFPKGQFAAEAKKKLSELRGGSDKKAPAAPKAPAKAAEKIELIWKRYEAVNNLKLHAEPDSGTKVLGTLGRGQQILVVGRVAGRDWYKVSVKAGQFAYAARAMLRPPAAAQKAPPKQAPTNVADVIQDCPECPELVRVAAGTFKMGSTTGDSSERPVHTVRISKPFAIGKYEVTIAQWQACVKAGGCAYTPRLGKAKPNDPVRKLSWSDAMRYVAWLRKKTGQKYRLPTEAEWEYAARAGSDALYWWGDRMAPGLADCKKCDPAWNRKLPQSVGRDKPNPFGLHGVSGGVWEWTADCWHNDYAKAPGDGRAWDAADCRGRVLRGGSWRNDATYARAASRLRYDFDVRYSTNGFRVARDLR